MTAALQIMERVGAVDTHALFSIYRFWFGDDPASAEIDPVRIQFWMFQNDDTDRQIREGFGHLLQPAARVNWKLAELTRQKAIALLARGFFSVVTRTDDKLPFMHVLTCPNEPATVAKTHLEIGEMDTLVTAHLFQRPTHPRPSDSTAETRYYRSYAPGNRRIPTLVRLIAVFGFLALALALPIT